MIRALCFALALVVTITAGDGLAQDSLTKPQKGLSLQKIAERQQDPSRAALDDAIRILKNGRYADAAAALYTQMRKNREHRDEARYNLAKALYRMGVFRSALYYFTRLLQQGPKNRFYRSSLEWCLFISRKMNDDDAVNEVVARYGGERFPAAYRNEFQFRLARFHFDRALAIERGEVAGQPEQTRIEERSTGGKSIKGDIFGDPVEGARPPPPAPPKQVPAPGKKNDKKGGGISLDDDLFGDPAPKPAPPPPPPPKKRKPKRPRSGEWTLSAEEHTDTAMRLIKQVDRSSKFGARAKFLEGVLLYKVGKPNEALGAFKEVIRATRALATQSDRRLRQMAFFQLARTHFGAEQPSFSIFYYDRVDRDSFAWLDALYEGSWAEFRLGNYEKALGNLLTLHAPFFSDSYYPESLILKAVVYYENCRYPEAKVILKDFLARYEPVHDELKRLTGNKQSYEAYYAALESMRAKAKRGGKGQEAILAQVLDLALSDPELERLDRAYREVDAEIRRLARTKSSFRSTRLFAGLNKLLARYRADLAKTAGRAVKNQLERERTEINQLIKQAVRIDIETARSEQERIESKLRAVQRRPKEIQKTFVEWTDDEKLVWPFDGEYWRDELGTYELTLAHSCR